MKEEIGTPTRSRLREVDVARALAAITVVALHVIGYSLSRDSAGSAAQPFDQALILALRFARQVFMLISGFALAYAYRSRPLHYRAFLSRRLRSVALPYVVWSVIYLIVVPPGDKSLWSLVSAVALGTAFYHLYYVVVSLQWYVIFPPVLAMARRLGPRAAWGATVTATAVYLGLAAWFTAGAPLPAWASPLSRLLPYKDQLLPSYLGYYVLGTLGGVHAEAVLGWLSRHIRWVGVAMAGLLGFLLLDLIHDGPEQFAHTVDIFRPGLVLYGLTGAAMVLACASRITYVGGRAFRWLVALSRNSYAIYLAHPIVLFLAESYLIPRLGWYHSALAIPLLLAGILVPHGLAMLLNSTPLAPLLLGNGFQRRRLSMASDSA
jgi:peptidoglycan/LPS O-acetylase OafA/YrhL